MVVPNYPRKNFVFYFFLEFFSLRKVVLKYTNRHQRSVIALKELMTPDPLFLADIICFKVSLANAFIDYMYFKGRNVAALCVLSSKTSCDVTGPKRSRNVHCKTLCLKCILLGQKHFTKSISNFFLGQVLCFFFKNTTGLRGSIW